MHILLMILRIIGTIIGILLLLILLLLCCIIFIPVRWRVSLRKEPAPEAEETVDGEGPDAGLFFEGGIPPDDDASRKKSKGALIGSFCISWFLRLVRFVGDYKEQELVLSLRAFGIPIHRFDKTIPIGKKKTSVASVYQGEAGETLAAILEDEVTGEAEPAAQETEQESNADTQETGSAAEVNEPETQETEPESNADTQETGSAAEVNEPETQETEPESRADAQETGPAAEVNEPETRATEPESNAETQETGPAAEANEPETRATEPESKADAQETGTEDAAPRKRGKRIRDAISRFGSRLKKIVSLVASIPGKVCNLLARLPALLHSILDKVDDLAWKLSDLAWKADDLVWKVEDKKVSLEDMASRYLTAENEAAVRLIVRRLLILLRHYGPRTAKGYLHFGTGAPDQTGILTGVFSYLLPAGAADFELNPAFYERCFDTDMTVKGHIRLCHAIWAVIILLLDKNVRGLIRVIRKKDRADTKKKHRKC